MQTNLNTKEKGDIGLTKVISDFTELGFNVLLPIAEHLPYDLVIASSDNQKLKRISVKYITEVSGTIRLPLRSISTNMKGWKAKTIDFSCIDGFAIYCPDHKEVYYIPVAEVKDLKAMLYLRKEKPSRAGDYRLCQNYLDPSKI